MNQVLVFNHHSIPFKSQSEARSAVQEFVRVALGCRNYGYNLILLDECIDRSWFQVQLAPNYAWRNWYEEARNDDSLKDVVRAFRSLETRQPLLTEIDLEQIGHLREVGMKDEKQGLSALLACYFYGSFLISFSSSDKWASNSLQVWVLDLDENGNDFSESETSLNNVFSTESLEFHKEALENYRDEQLTSGKDLWNQRQVFFPELEFLDEFSDQLKGWRHRSDILVKAKDVLFRLNEFVDRWKKGEFSNYQHEHLASCGLSAKVSGESSSVNLDPSKKSEREFWLPKGIKVNCQNHVTLPDGYRLHFYPDPAEKIIYIAYLGPHLTL